MILLVAAEQHACKTGSDDLSIAGTGEVLRHYALAETVDREQRTRRMLDSELARLGTPTGIGPDHPN